MISKRQEIINYNWALFQFFKYQKTSVQVLRFNYKKDEDFKKALKGRKFKFLQDFCVLAMNKHFHPISNPISLKQEIKEQARFYNHLRHFWPYIAVQPTPDVVYKKTVTYSGKVKKTKKTKRIEKGRPMTIDREENKRWVLANKGKGQKQIAQENNMEVHNVEYRIKLTRQG